MTPKSKKPCPCCQKARREILNKEKWLREFAAAQPTWSLYRDEYESEAKGFKEAAAILARHGKLSEK